MSNKYQGAYKPEHVFFIPDDFPADKDCLEVIQHISGRIKGLSEILFIANENQDYCPDSKSTQQLAVTIKGLAVQVDSITEHLMSKGYN